MTYIAESVSPTGATNSSHHAITCERLIAPHTERETWLTGSRNMFTFGLQKVHPRDVPALLSTLASVPTADPISQNSDRLKLAADDSAEGNSVGLRHTDSLVGETAPPESRPCRASFQYFCAGIHSELMAGALVTSWCGLAAAGILPTRSLTRCPTLWLALHSGRPAAGLGRSQGRIAGPSDRQSPCSPSRVADRKTEACASKLTHAPPGELELWRCGSSRVSDAATQPHSPPTQSAVSRGGRVT
eukprot:COSAG01_NODE_4366_length_5093_cov_5.796155_3_plen_245_part_00